MYVALDQKPIAPPRIAAPAYRIEVRKRIAAFERANSFRGYLSFAIDIVTYAIGIAGVLLFPPLAAKIFAGVLAGVGLINLGSLSHEAAHRAVVKSKLGNKLISMACFTAILFNYRLWVYDHHVLHHTHTNVKEDNFCSPLSIEEYRSLAPWRRAIYRLYRSSLAINILVYYLVERWPTVHFYPGKWLPKRYHASAWRYTAVLTVYAAALLTLLALAPTFSNTSAVTAICLGFVVPYAIWFTVFAMTAFLQHTNPGIRWYRDVASVATPAEALTVHVVMPGWINYVTHYVMEHNIHHISAMVPHYHLKKAQSLLIGLTDKAMITMPFSIDGMRDVFRRCKLYDYDRHLWLDFEGTVTGVPIAGFEREDELPIGGGFGSGEGSTLPGQTSASPGIFFPADFAAQTAEPATAPREGAPAS